MTLPNKQTDLEVLFLKSLDGMLSDEEYAKLTDCLREDPATLDYYLEFMSVCAGMIKPGEMTLPNDDLGETDDLRQSALLLALAEDELTAEPVYIEKPNPELPVVPFHRETIPFRQRISSASLYTAIISTAALLLMITYVVTHPRVNREPVATLTGSSQAVWQQAEGSPGEMGRLYTNTIMNLVEGFAEITFDNQAKIIIQSPAEFNIEDYHQLVLRSGKLTAVIPKTAWGFVVRTAGASVVDYGTEFGVTADAFGRTEAHVFVGKIELRSGSDPVRFGGAMKLIKGQAGRVDEAGELTVEAMKAQPASFVRRLPKKKTFGEPGKRLDLADIVGGGNGFGTGSVCVGVNPASGQVTDTLLFSNRQQDRRQYHPVPDMPCIDGVFVPLGGDVPQIVTSHGHVFEDCPKTDGCYWNEITNKPLTSILGNAEGEPDDMQLARLNGVQYGTDMHPAIMLHANAGITFDLDAIRSTIPGVQIRNFTSSCGLSDTLINTTQWGNVAADLWVLVDGQKRQAIHLTFAAQRTACVHVNINENDRFLTLIATDGENGNGGDWTLFGDPALELERMN